MKSGSCSQISSSCNCPIPVQTVSAPSLVKFPAFPCLFLKKKTRKVMALSLGISRFADLVSVNEFPKGHGNENSRKKTKENIALLRILFDAKNESRARTKFCHTNSIHSFTHS